MTETEDSGASREVRMDFIEWQKKELERSEQQERDRFALREEKEARRCGERR